MLRFLRCGSPPRCAESATRTNLTNPTNLTKLTKLTNLDEPDEPCRTLSNLVFCSSSWIKSGILVANFETVLSGVKPLDFKESRSDITVNLTLFRGSGFAPAAYPLVLAFNLSALF